MKVQVGELFVNSEGKRITKQNKTLKYLVPCLRSYGKDLERMYNSVFKVAIGLGDSFNPPDDPNELALYILLDSNVAPKHFQKFLQWIREREYYIIDYTYGNASKSTYHMVVLHFPEEYSMAYYKFLSGTYSEMYTKDQVKELFKPHPETQGILLKDKSYKAGFVKELNRKYETSISVKEWDGEYDFPPDKGEEYFD